MILPGCLVMGLPVCLVGPGSITEIIAAQGLELQAQRTEHARIEALDKTTEDLAPKALHAWGYFGQNRGKLLERLGVEAGANCRGAAALAVGAEEIHQLLRIRDQLLLVVS